MKARQILPIALLVLILGPATLRLLDRPEPPPAVLVARAPEPRIEPPPATPDAWFERVHLRCTPAEVRLTTDLLPPPEGVEGTGYESACFALAGKIPDARALLLGLPEGDRIRGATQVYDVARALADQGRHDAAGPLMELVLEFWPNHYLALYEAATARYRSGDIIGARSFLERFLEVHRNQDDLEVEAQRMLSGAPER
jgi:tetratricopeptide (TPR) repeat protein